MLVFFPCMLYIVRFTKVGILFISRFLKQRNLPYGDRLCWEVIRPRITRDRSFDSRQGVGTFQPAPNCQKGKL